MIASLAGINAFDPILCLHSVKTITYSVRNASKSEGADRTFLSERPLIQAKTTTRTMGHGNSDLGEEYRALVGECAWHSLTIDPSLEQISAAHYDYVVSALEGRGRGSRTNGMKVLEVASYAHTTGYRLQQELGCEVTLFDISAKALQLGKRMAGAAGLAACPQLVAGDFHALPFEANSFDIVYICSAVHHTWKYETVLSELQRVLAPGGLLLLLNEPCHRQCCFYGFRTNRPATSRNLKAF